MTRNATAVKTPLVLSMLPSSEDETDQNAVPSGIVEPSSKRAISPSATEAGARRPSPVRPAQPA